MIPFIGHYGKGKTVRIEDRSVAARGRGSVITVGHEEHFRGMKTYILIMVAAQLHTILKLVAVLKRVNFTERKLRIDTSDFLEAAQSNYADKIISWSGALSIVYKGLRTIDPPSCMCPLPQFLLI